MGGSNIIGLQKWVGPVPPTYNGSDAHVCKSLFSVIKLVSPAYVMTVRPLENSRAYADLRSSDECLFTFSDRCLFWRKSAFRSTDLGEYQYVLV